MMDHLAVLCVKTQSIISENQEDRLRYQGEQTPFAAS
jgi:hypothetical protein